MMRCNQKLASIGITSQIITLVAVSVLLGGVLGIAVALTVLDPPDDPPGFWVARISDVTRFVRAARDSREVESVLSTVRRSGIEVEMVPLSSVMYASTGQKSRPLRSAMVLHLFAAQRGINLRVRYGGDSRSQIVAQVDDERALVFSDIPRSSVWPLLLTPAVVLVIIASISALLLSLYAAKVIISPLSRLARAVAAFGRSTDANEVLGRRGPKEIIEVSDALDDMRDRIRMHLKERARMLAAISHDLRTPLTHLKLRCEEIERSDLKDAMLRKIDQISRMLNETLEYMRDDSKVEGISRVELTSLLETICADFSDVGYTVSYFGPDRLLCECRPRALTRAITNVVENAVKYGSTVSVTLTESSQNKICVDVADDGPGIPDALRSVVFEPFVKMDHTQPSSDASFGLGLSIAKDIMKKQDGDIELLPNRSKGLLVRLTLPTSEPTKGME